MLRFGRERAFHCPISGDQTLPRQQVGKCQACQATTQPMKQFTPRAAQIVHGRYTNSFRLKSARQNSANASGPACTYSTEAERSKASGTRPSANRKARST